MASVQRTNCSANLSAGQMAGGCTSSTAPMYWDLRGRVDGLCLPFLRPLGSPHPGRAKRLCLGTLGELVREDALTTWRSERCSLPAALDRVVLQPVLNSGELPATVPLGKQALHRDSTPLGISQTLAADIFGKKGRIPAH